MRSELKPLSREFLLSRGRCCNNGCKNCPYKDGLKESTKEPNKGASDE